MITLPLQINPHWAIRYKKSDSLPSLSHALKIDAEGTRIRLFMGILFKGSCLYNSCSPESANAPVSL